MLFGTKQQIVNFETVNVVHRGIEFERCIKYKYLGIVLDSRLTFEEHANYIKSKTIGQIRLLRRIRHIIDRDTAMLLYKTLIVPIYDYCDHIYFPLSVNSADSLQKLQNIALRTIVRAEPCTSTNSLHTSANASTGPQKKTTCC